MSGSPARPQAPRAQARPVRSSLHGVTIEDPFAWLKAGNWREVLKDPASLPADIRAHLEAENAHAEAFLSEIDHLIDELAAEMRARIKEDESSPPSPDGPFAYYSRYREGGQHRLVCRRPREGGPEDLLLDGDALAAGKPFFDLADTSHAPDHRLLAWSADEAGSEFHEIRVRDLATGQDLPDLIRDTTGSVIWTADSTGFLYTALDENHRPFRVRLHRLGTPAEADVTIFEDADPGWFVGLHETQAGRFAVIAVRDHETSECRLLDLADPLAPPVLVAARETGVRYEVEVHGQRLFIRTNADGAEDFRIVEAPLANPARDQWRDVVAHRPGVMILSLAVFRDHLARLEREDGLPRIVVRRLADGAEHAIAFDEEAYSLSMQPGFEFDTTRLRFTYSSMTRPAETFDYDMETRERVLVKRQEIPSGHDPALYVTRRIMAVSHDGETVPVSLVHRRDVSPGAPCLLYGYGSYGSSIPAAFSTTRLSLVDRGFVYAIAHIRGGTEKGWRWYLDGKRGKKINSFHDFIAAARALSQAGLTAPGRIVAHGRSAGGMLMGAVANMAPELFGGIVAEVPFVDVLATMLDRDLPLTPPEWPEWGNPGEDEQAFRTILSYSPVDNVAPRPYPAILALAGLTDPRVTYWEPAKWVARLREATTSDRPIVLRIDMSSGHGGASGRFDRLREVAMAYAFALRIMAGDGGGRA
jgi:oligopeptidase B